MSYENRTPRAGARGNYYFIPFYRRVSAVADGSPVASLDDFALIPTPVMAVIVGVGGFSESLKQKSIE